MHNIVIPLFTFLVGLIRYRISKTGSKWFRALKHPKGTPSQKTLEIVWQALYVLAAISALIVWNKFGDEASIWIGLVFLLNGILSCLYCYFFYVKNDFTLSVYELSALNITVILLIYMIWPLSVFAALILLPYFVWASFITYLICKGKKLN